MGWTDACPRRVAAEITRRLLLGMGLVRSLMTFKVAVVGTGADPENPDTDGYAMAYRHAGAYRRLDSCSLVACADIIPENAADFGDRWDIPEENVYEDSDQMLADVEPDIVSVCVPPHVHADVVKSVATAASVRAIHCEKPMATTWSDCEEMVAVCEDQHVQLTFNHQRRFGGPFRKAKSELDAGSIGQLERIEIGGKNLFDYGSHLFDLCGFLTDQSPPAWVLAGIDYSEENIQFGAHNENMAIAQWQYENGVSGLAATGEESILVPQVRLIGSEGRIDIGTTDGPIRMRTDGTWRTLDADGDTIHGPAPSRLEGAKQRLVEKLPILTVEKVRSPTFIDRAIEEIVDALESGRTSELDAENALQATSLIFGCWESSRRRERVDFPLDISDNPLESMVDSGELLAD